MVKMNSNDQLEQLKNLVDIFEYVQRSGTWGLFCIAHKHCVRNLIIEDVPQVAAAMYCVSPAWSAAERGVYDLH
jgi:hypothetical protein